MADPEGIYNWHRLDSRITTSGQPSEAQLAEIRGLGVRHIVNLGLHTHEKALPDEAAMTKMQSRYRRAARCERRRRGPIRRGNEPDFWPRRPDPGSCCRAGAAPFDC